MGWPWLYKLLYIWWTSCNKPSRNFRQIKSFYYQKDLCLFCTISVSISNTLPFTDIILCQNFLWNTIKHFLRKDAKKRPRKIKRFVNSSRFVVTLSSFQPLRNIVPWLTNCFSNFSRNSKLSLSSWLRASSPTTAFIAWASRPMAYFAY